MNTQWAETCKIKEPVFIVSGMSTYRERMMSDSAAEQGLQENMFIWALGSLLDL